MKFFRKSYAGNYNVNGQYFTCRKLSKFRILNTAVKLESFWAGSCNFKYNS